MLAVAEEHGAEMAAIGISCNYADAGKRIGCEVKKQGAFFGREGFRKAICAPELSESFPFSANMLYRRSLRENHRVHFEKIHDPVGEYPPHSPIVYFAKLMRFAVLQRFAWLPEQEAEENTHVFSDYTCIQ